MSDRLERFETIDKYGNKTYYRLPVWVREQVQSYIDTETTKGLLKNPSKLRIGMLRQALNEDRITDPNKMVDNEYIEHWLGIAELKLKGEKE